MKKIILALVLGMVAIPGISKDLMYLINLYSVECRDEKGTIRMDTVDSSISIDSLISTSWTVSNKVFHFTLKNRTTETIYIDWDEILFINNIGRSERMAFGGTTYADRLKTHPLSKVIKGTFISETLIPMSNVEHLSGYNFKGYIYPDPILDARKFASKQIKDVVYKQSKMMIGTKVKVIFPIKVGDKKYEYEYTFILDEIRWGKLSSKDAKD